MGSFIFGYGTFITRFASDFNIIAEIDGYKRVYHASPYFGRWYPFVIKKACQKCRGLLINDEEGDILPELDEYEDYPRLYDRIEVPFTIVSDPDNRLGLIDQDDLKAWLYVPSARTESLTLDRIFKDMKKQDINAYKELMDNDMWLAKLRVDNPEIVDQFPALFENSNKIEDLDTCEQEDA